MCINNKRPPFFSYLLVAARFQPHQRLFIALSCFESFKGFWVLYLWVSRESPVLKASPKFGRSVARPGIFSENPFVNEPGHGVQVWGRNRSLKPVFGLFFVWPLLLCSILILGGLAWFVPQCSWHVWSILRDGKESSEKLGQNAGNQRERIAFRLAEAQPMRCQLRESSDELGRIPMKWTLRVLCLALAPLLHHFAPQLFFSLSCFYFLSFE